MIIIHPSKTADTRTCDYSKVTKEQLVLSSLQHITDVRAALHFFERKLSHAAETHDSDKIDLAQFFHDDFVTGFKQTSWWDGHRRGTRHHLSHLDGVPNDVNLIDVLEYIADCVMAGMARSGSVSALQIDPHVLNLAFGNTVELLKSEVVVVSGEK